GSAAARRKEVAAGPPFVNSCSAAHAQFPKYLCREMLPQGLASSTTSANRLGCTCQSGWIRRQKQFPSSAVYCLQQDLALSTASAATRAQWLHSPAWSATGHSGPEAPG